MSEMAYTTAIQEKSPERESIIKEFEWAITEHQSVVAELAMRLDPILRPSEPPKIAGPDSPPMLNSQVRSRLYDLHSLTGSLRDLLNRLEV